MRDGRRRTSHGTTKASAPCRGSPRFANKLSASASTHPPPHSLTPSLTHALPHIQVREEAERQVDRQRAPLHRATVTGAIAGAGPGGVLGHPAPGVGSAGSAVVCASLGLAQAERAGLGGADGAQDDPLKRDLSRKFAVGGDGTTKAEERMRARREVGGSACACDARTRSLSPLSHTLSPHPTHGHRWRGKRCSTPNAPPYWTSPHPPSGQPTAREALAAASRLVGSRTGNPSVAAQRLVPMKQAPAPLPRRSPPRRRPHVGGPQAGAQGRQPCKSHLGSCLRPPSAR